MLQELMVNLLDSKDTANGNNDNVVDAEFKDVSDKAEKADDKQNDKKTNSNK